MDHDPNGELWQPHEPSCRQCGRFDANCSCDLEWPQPMPPPFEADDEAREVPNDA